MSQAARLPTKEDIKHTHFLIERCLEEYKSKAETMDELYRDNRIDPLLTHLVWEQLESENQVFFREYYSRLRLIEQIKVFNDLSAKVQRQIEESRNPSSHHVVAHQTAATSSTPGGNAPCNGGTLSAVMHEGFIGNGTGFSPGIISSSQNVNMEMGHQGMNSMSEISFTSHAPENRFMNQAPPPNGHTVVGCQFMPGRGISDAPEESRNPYYSYDVHQTAAAAASLTPSSALCNGGTSSAIMHEGFIGNGTGFSTGIIPSSQINESMEMDGFSFSFDAPENGFMNQTTPPNGHTAAAGCEFMTPGIISDAVTFATSDNLQGLVEQHHHHHHHHQQQQQLDMVTWGDGFLSQPAENGFMNQAPPPNDHTATGSEFMAPELISDAVTFATSDNLQCLVEQQQQQQQQLNMATRGDGFWSQTAHQHVSSKRVQVPGEHIYQNSFAVPPKSNSESILFTTFDGNDAVGTPSSQYFSQ